MSREKNKVVDTCMAETNRGPVRYRKREDGTRTLELSIEQIRDLAIGVKIRTYGSHGRKCIVEFD